MRKIILLIVGMACFLSLSTSVFAGVDDVFQRPFYAGISGGIGSTTWRGLVPPNEKQNMAMNVSTPIDVNEGGAVFGAFVGYEFTRYFALEANYRHYHEANVIFAQDSMFAFEHDENASFHTDTETINLMGKIMLVIPSTTLRLYSSAGIAGIHRDDSLNRQWQPAPVFGLGFNYSITEHWMAECGFNFTAGYGESELNPANDYVPFLYSAALSIAYRF